MLNTSDRSFKMLNCTPWANKNVPFLPRDALQCKARSCDRMVSVCPSVSLSVTLVDQDHIGCKSWKLIARTISATHSLFVPPEGRHPPTPRETWGNLGETRGGVGKNGVLQNKSGNISITRKEREKVTMEGGYRNSHSLFRAVPSPTPYGFLFPKIGGSHPTQNSNRYYLRNRYPH